NASGEIIVQTLRAERAALLQDKHGRGVRRHKILILNSGTDFSTNHSPIYLYTFTPLHLYTYTPIYLYTFIPLYLYTFRPMRNLILLLPLPLLIAGSCMVPAQLGSQQQVKRAPYEKITFEDLAKRYLEKADAANSIEGIYSVSSVVIKKGPQFISGEVRERVIERQENYARVAILKERPGSKREYVEVSLTYREAGTYPVVGEFNVFGEGRGLIYKH